ncbi:MAG TPA: S9 family peptidase [Bacteroidia bacterium]|nr:S9 family peptidase [Bacteroidia bacterium]
MKKLTLFIVLLWCGMVSAQSTLTPELLWQFKRISDQQVSPDGKWMIYSARSYTIKENSGASFLYLYDLEKNTQRILLDSTENAMQARWRPDGKKIGFIKYDDKGAAQLWEMNPDGSNMAQVTSIEEGITWYKYVPGMKYLAYGQDVKMDKEVKDIYPDLDKVDARIIDGLMYRHWNGWSDYTYSHIFLAPYADGGKISEGKDIMAGQRYNAPMRPFGGEEQVNFSPDGSTIVYACKKLEGTEAAYSTNSQIYVYSIDGASETIASGCGDGYDNNAEFSPSGTYLAWLSMKRPGNEADKNRILVNNYKDKGTTADDITKDFAYSVDAFTWSPDEKKIYFLSVINATSQLFEYDFKSNKIKQLTQGEHDINSVSVYTAGKKTMFIGHKNSMSRPAALFKYDAAGKETPLININEGLIKNISWGTVKKRMVKTTDGKEMLTWVIYPPNFDSTRQYPALLYCQGGPQSPVSQFFSYRWNFQLMAANGYVVVAPNRRGLPGFGQEWNDQIMNDYGGQAMKDYLSAIDDVSKEKYVNKDKLGAVGASFGGYSVYWLAGNHNKRFKCFISHCGMFNMESWFGTTEEMFFAKNDNGYYWENTANYEKHSPHNYVKNWDAPILVIHNEKDFRVPLGEGMQAFTAAQTLGIPSRFLYFPDEGHWILKPQNSILWNRVFFEWLDKWLK